MWRQSSPEILGLRRAIRQRIEPLLLGSNEFQAEETPQRFVRLLQEVEFMELNSSTENRAA
jgi:hypothetical protein